MKLIDFTLRGTMTKEDSYFVLYNKYDEDSKTDYLYRAIGWFENKQKAVQFAVSDHKKKRILAQNIEEKVLREDIPESDILVVVESRRFFGPDKPKSYEAYRCNKDTLYDVVIRNGGKDIDRFYFGIEEPYKPTVADIVRNVNGYSRINK